MTSRNRQKPDGEFLGNGRGRWTMLDRALEGASAEEKARVRGVLLRYGIDEDNEFFMIFVAIGHLLILVEEAPENWRSLFDDVHLELKQWSQENFKSLESIKQHTQTSADLIAVLRRLLDSMKNFDSRSDKMRSTLHDLELKLIAIESTSDLTHNHSRQALRTLNGLESQLQSLINLLGTWVEKGNRRAWISTFSAACGALTVALLLLNGRATSRQMKVQALMIQQQSERIDWLLAKANRQECLQGIKPKSDPQCRQYQ
jgi:hypothetical protein